MSGARNDGGPAFPHEDSGSCAFRPGMTLRDYFAGKALPEAIRFLRDEFKSDGGFEWSCADDEPPTTSEDMAAQKAYSMADAMLKARSA